MNNLFIQPVEFEKVAYKQVSEDPSDWVGNIMESFYNQFPYFANAEVSVNLSQKDEAKGYALGQIQVSEGPGLTVPVVIRARELYPFDVAIMNGNVIPLTTATLRMMVENRGAFWRVVKPEAGDVTNAVFNTSFSQDIVPNYLSDMGKTGSLSEDSAIMALREQLRVQSPGQATSGAALLSASIPQDDMLSKMERQSLLGGQLKTNEMFAQLKQTYSLRRKEGLLYMMLMFKKWAGEQGYETNGWIIPGFEKSAESILTLFDKNAKPVGTTVNPESLIDKIAHTITQEQKDQFFSVIQNDEAILESFKRNGTGKPILKLATVKPEQIDFKERVRNGLDRDIHYIYKAGAHDWKMVVGNSKIEDPVELSVDSRVEELMPEGIKSAFVKPEEMEKTADVKHMFESGGRKFILYYNGDYSELEPEQTAALNGLTKTAELENQEVEITKTAVWIRGDYATSPFEVLSIYSHDGEEVINTWNGLEKRSYTYSKHISEPLTENGATYLPLDTKFIKLGKKVGVRDRMIEHPEYDNTITKLASNEYHLNGSVFSNYLKDKGPNHNLHKTAWHMVQCGSDPVDVEKLASMKDGESTTLNYELHLPIPFDSVVKRMEDSFEKDSELIGSIARNFIKEASALEDLPTVDAILSLNFVNKSNVREFADALPLFVETSKKMADMLLKTRIGVEILSEDVLRRVMLGLIEIIEILTGTQSTVV